MCHVTHKIELCHVTHVTHLDVHTAEKWPLMFERAKYVRVMSLISMSHARHMNDSRHTLGCPQGKGEAVDTGGSHVTHIKK